MARLTVHGSRADRLLTLGRLALPDALRRADQPPAVAIGLALLYLAVATAGSLPLLSLLFGIDDEALRRNLLNLGISAVAALWLLAQVVLRLPVNWLLDLEPFLPLPVAYRDLYLLRLAFSLVGYWLLVLGPAALFLLATRTEGPVDFLLISGALGVTVLLLGRMAAIVTLAIDRFVESLIGVLGVFLVVVALIQAAGIVINVLGGEASLEALEATVRKAKILVALGYTPPGLLAAILDSPGQHLPNLLRLGILLVLLAATGGVEYGLLLRRYLLQPGGDRRTASPVTPLAGLLRRCGNLSPATCLALVEVECCLRAKGVRWAYAMALGYATWGSIDLLFGLMAAALLTVLMVNGVLTEKPPPSCQVWRESLSLPLGSFRIFRTPTRVPALLTVPVATLGTSGGIVIFGVAGWRPAATAAVLVTATVLLADAAFSLIRLYWPKHKTAGATEFELENLAASSVAGLSVMALFFLTIVVSRLLERPGNGFLIGFLTSGALVGTVLARHASTIRQRREIESRAHELLLGDPSH